VQFAICLHAVQQSRDAVCNAELGGSRELHRKGHFWGSGLFRQISAKSGIFFKKYAAKFHIFPAKYVVRCLIRA